MPKKTSEALKAYTKKSGDAFKKSPIYRAEVARMPKGRTDYGRRQSSNIIDVQDKPPRPGMNPVRTKAYKYEDAKGKQAQKAQESSVLDSSRIRNVSDENTRNRNIVVNGLRQTHGSTTGRHIKNKDLDAKPTTFVKSKKKKKK